MTKLKTKKTLSIVSLTCCEGCQFAILDLGERLVGLLQDFDLREFSLVMSDKKEKPLDIAVVEGTPITAANFQKLEKVREKASILIAFGSCAHLGGFQQLKNYGDKLKHLKYVYKNTARLDNPAIKPLSAFVKVDYVIPGCPINAEEFVSVISALRDDKSPHIADQTVCWECQLKGNECLLQQGLPCYGPIIWGGCSAVCPTHGFPCYACRGPVREPNIESLRQIFKKNGLEKDFEILMQEFGAADEILSKDH